MFWLDWSLAETHKTTMGPLAMGLDYGKAKPRPYGLSNGPLWPLVVAVTLLFWLLLFNLLLWLLGREEGKGETRKVSTMILTWYFGTKWLTLVDLSIIWEVGEKYKFVMNW